MPRGIQPLWRELLPLRNQAHRWPTNPNSLLPRFPVQRSNPQGSSRDHHQLTQACTGNVFHKASLWKPVQASKHPFSCQGTRPEDYLFPLSPWKRNASSRIAVPNADSSVLRSCFVVNHQWRTGINRARSPDSIRSRMDTFAMLPPLFAPPPRHAHTPGGPICTPRVRGIANSGRVSVRQRALQPRPSAALGRPTRWCVSVVSGEKS